MSKSNAILNKLFTLGKRSDAEGMKRFGINISNALGIRMPVLRNIAKEFKGDHQLALDLWKSGYHEARILATMIDNPKLVTSDQMDEWVGDFNSWDLCDQACGNLFSRSKFVIEKVNDYTCSSQEFVKRAGFSLMANYAVKGKTVSDDVFINFFPIIEREAYDNRNFVKKAVNWALRQIGKKNLALCVEALKCAENIKKQNSSSSRLIANDSIRELNAKIKSL